MFIVKFRIIPHSDRRWTSPAVFLVTPLYSIFVRPMGFGAFLE